ncbi:MAG: anti-sigma regulatory factor [Calditrichia bacterium]
MKSKTRKGQKFQLKLPINTANLEIVRDFVSKIAQNMGFSDEEIHRIELAVDEASTNVIKHAYRNSNDSKKVHFIYVDATAYEDRLEISVVDQGQGFNPEKIKTPEMETYLKKMRRGGLGLYLIKTLMDKVDYSIKPGVRNRVKMVKYIS